MKKFVQPPLVILLDVLFIFLFVSILEKPPKINYELPPNKLFEGGYIISVDSDGKRRVYNSQTHTLSDKFYFPTSKHGLYFSVFCEKQVECRKARELTSDTLEIAITGKTYDDIARLTFIGCNIDPSQCSNIKFSIEGSGKVNKDKLLEDNPFFAEIEGFLRSKF